MFTWHRGDFHPGASSLRFPLMALYLFTWYHHKMSRWREAPRCEFTPVLVPGREFHSRYEISQRYHVNAKRPPVSVWNRSAGWLEQVGHAYCLLFWITRVFYQREVYLQITRYEMAQSSCKRDTKSKSQPAVKLAPLRVLSCKHPLK